MEPIDFEKEQRQNEDQDFALNRQLLKRIEITEGVFSDIKNLIESGEITRHLEDKILERV